MSKEVSLLGIRLILLGSEMQILHELPKEDKRDTYYSVMEQFDVLEGPAKELISKFKQLVLDVERIVR